MNERRDSTTTTRVSHVPRDCESLCARAGERTKANKGDGSQLTGPVHDPTKANNRHASQEEPRGCFFCPLVFQPRPPGASDAWGHGGRGSNRTYYGFAKLPFRAPAPASQRGRRETLAYAFADATNTEQIGPHGPGQRASYKSGGAHGRNPHNGDQALISLSHLSFPTARSVPPINQPNPDRGRTQRTNPSVAAAAEGFRKSPS